MPGQQRWCPGRGHRTVRFRSAELAQHEVAYYFSALALGLIAGLGIEPVWLTAALVSLILLVMFVGGHPRVLPAHRHQTVILDRALAEDGGCTHGSRKFCTARSTPPPS